jgi:hypothetical protein
LIPNILGLEYKEIKPIIDYKIGNNPIGDKYVVISPYSTAGLKHWDFERWEKLSEWLVSLGYKVVNISKDSVKSKFIDNLKNTSIENTLNYIHHSEFMIGLSSGLSWLSWAAGKHVFMISNFTEPDHEFTTNCTRFINKSVCNGCWNKPKFKFDKGDWDWCPEHKGTDRQFECHKSITVEDVINGIKSFLGIEEDNLKSVDNYSVERNEMDVTLIKLENKNTVSTEIEVSIGEIVDKLSILRLKLLNITDKEKLKNVTKEYDYLYQIVFHKLNIDTSDFDKMVSINKILWDVEDRIREKEREKQFDSDFIEMARTVYITNDQRAEIKKEINTKYGSSFVEEKSYSDYN